jgi:hypothetical protein
MISRSHFLGKPLAIASVFLLALVLFACEQSKQAEPAPSKAASLTAPTEKVFVVFEGPWAFATDPKDASSVLALAPKTKSHRDLNVAASNSTNLAAGVYNLSIPPHSETTAASTLDSSFAQAKIDAKSLQHAVDDKSGRYVIRLPKPEAYVAAGRFRSRVGPTYPPDASTEQNYAISVSLRYSVSSLSGFSLAGTPDSGTFNPLLLQVDTPTIRFVIEPAMADVPTDLCSTHSRESFRDLVKFLSLTLYVDFPGDPSDCHKTDPQGAHPAKAEAGQTSPLERLAAFLSKDLTDVQTASTGGDTAPNYLRSLTKGGVGNTLRDLMAAAYFFHVGGGACKAPILFLTTTP